MLLRSLFATVFSYFLAGSYGHPMDARICLASHKVNSSRLFNVIIYPDCQMIVLCISGRTEAAFSLKCTNSCTRDVICYPASNTGVKRRRFKSIEPISDQKSLLAIESCPTEKDCRKTPLRRSISSSQPWRIVQTINPDFIFASNDDKAYLLSLNDSTHLWEVHGSLSVHSCLDPDEGCLPQRLFPFIVLPKSERVPREGNKADDDGGKHGSKTGLIFVLIVVGILFISLVFGAIIGFTCYRRRKSTSEGSKKGYEKVAQSETPPTPVPDDSSKNPSKTPTSNPDASSSDTSDKKKKKHLKKKKKKSNKVSEKKKKEKVNKEDLKNQVTPSQTGQTLNSEFSSKQAAKLGSKKSKKDNTPLLRSAKDQDNNTEYEEANLGAGEISDPFHIPGFRAAGPLAPEHIPADKFNHRGSLNIKKHRRPAYKHALDKEKLSPPKANECVKFDSQMNEVFDIGPGVENISNRTTSGGTNSNAMEESTETAVDKTQQLEYSGEMEGKDAAVFDKTQKDDSFSESKRRDAAVDDRTQNDEDLSAVVDDTTQNDEDLVEKKDKGFDMTEKEEGLSVTDMESKDTAATEKSQKEEEESSSD